jgi:hypothetical protein
MTPRAMLRRARKLRGTIASYIDQTGTRVRWSYVGELEHCQTSWARIDFSELLGHAYVERPYKTRRDSPHELTVADRRGLDGKRIFQVFSGSLQANANSPAGGSSLGIKRQQVADRVGARAEAGNAALAK